MKKHLIILFLAISSVSICEAQWLPLSPMEYLTYYYENYTYKRMLVQDSLIYTTRHRGLEEINMNNYSINYYWSNYYPVDGVIADTGNTFVYLVYNDSIMRFNPIIQKYENVWPDSLSYKSLADIDVAPNGNMWAVTTGNIKEVAIYNGLNWELYTFTPIMYGFFRDKCSK